MTLVSLNKREEQGAAIVRWMEVLVMLVIIPARGRSPWSLGRNLYRSKRWKRVNPELGYHTHDVQRHRAETAD